jgi:single-stranded DNA-binding protein
MISHYICTGNLGAPAELKNVGSGLLSFRMGVSTGWGDRKATHWVTCNLWGKRATETLTAILDKGTRVTCSGTLSNREYERQDGTKAYSLELNLDEIDIHPKDASNNTQLTPQAPSSPPPDEDNLLDGVPF